MSYAISVISFESAMWALMLALGGFFMMAHIFCFNDWSDNSFDSHQGSEGVRTLTSDRIGNREMLALALILGMAGLLTFTLISRTLTIIAAGAISLGIVY